MESSFYVTKLGVTRSLDINVANLQDRVGKEKKFSDRRKIFRLFQLVDVAHPALAATPDLILYR